MKRWLFVGVGLGAICYQAVRIFLGFGFEPESFFGAIFLSGMLCYVYDEFRMRYRIEIVKKVKP